MTDTVPEPLAPDRALAVALAPAAARPALETLFALDRRLAGLVRATREPMIGQMRLAWWHQALGALDDSDAPAEPLLQALRAQVLPRGVDGAALAAMIDGWEALIAADSLDDAALDSHAESRGAGLFAAAARVLGGDSPSLAPAGRGWALADLAAHLTMEGAAARARDRAHEQISLAFAMPWPKTLRPIGLLALLVRLHEGAATPLANAIRTTRFRLTGR